MPAKIDGDALIAFDAIQPFLSRPQYRAMRDFMHGEEGQYYLDKAHEVARVIQTMPQTYQQTDSRDPVVYLHYFLGGSDWYITEKDMEGGVEQAYGYACLNGDDEMAEMGYISIAELVALGAELDLYWKQSPLSSVRYWRASVSCN